jgi:hypothetical protein
MLDPQKVDDLIGEFEHTPDLQLERLKDMARELSGQYYWYTKALSEAGKAYRETRAKRKAKYAELVQTFGKTEKSNAAAAAKAEDNDKYRELYTKEYQYEGSERGGTRICDAIKKVIDRMGQEIADLRKEKEYDRFTEGKQGQR